MVSRAWQSEDERSFFASGRDVQTVLEAARKACDAGSRVYGAVLTTSTDLGKRMFRLTDGWGRIRGFTVTGKSPYLIELSRRNDEGKVVGKFKAFMWQQPNSELCYFLTYQPREEFLHFLDVVHSYLQPDVCRLYLKTPQLEESLQSVAKEYPKLSIRVSQYVARKWRDGRRRAGEKDTTVQYCDEDYASVFQKLKAEGLWMTSLKIGATGPNVAVGRLARDGSFSCQAGFQFFFHEFVGKVAQITLGVRELYKNRSRVDSPTKSSKPLKIVYRSGIFGDKKNNYRLIRVLEDCPNSALSVFHPNPYLHASFIDYADGSSYSILVTTSTGILITPERKATTQSLARLCEFICDNFEEGEVVEFIPHDD